MVVGTGVEGIGLGPGRTPEASRNLALLDISTRLLLIEQEVEYCDTECDRALFEVGRLLQWIEGRLTRNGAFRPT